MDVMDPVDVMDPMDSKEDGIMENQESLIPKHGGYRKLKTFQLAQLCYDVTVRFCDRYVDKKSRTHDQMVQAARSGVQNIAEGSEASSHFEEVRTETHQRRLCQPRGIAT